MHGVLSRRMPPGNGDARTIGAAMCTRKCSDSAFRGGRTFCFATVAMILTLASPLARAQSSDAESPASIETSDSPEWMRKLKILPTSDTAIKLADQVKTREQKDKDLRRIRAKHFGTMQKVEIREAGIAKLAEYNDPALYPLMVELFEKEKNDVRTAMLDMFTKAESDAGDATLTWHAIFGRDEWMRENCRARLRGRLRDIETGNITHDNVKLVLYEALRSPTAKHRAAAAQMADALNFVEMIPWLAAAQLSAETRAPERPGALAWILVGQQTAFVSDLEPIVADSAVAFDPQISTITTGTMIRVDDAAVSTTRYIYNFDVHNSLVNMSTRNWGQGTATLGFDYRKWKEWYELTFEPYWQKKQMEVVKEHVTQKTAEESANPPPPKAEPGNGGEQKAEPK